MQLIDLELFLLVFFACYIVLAILVKLVHLITRNKSDVHTYRIAVIVCALLVAAMFTYNNLGRSGNLKYPVILAPSPTATPTQTNTPQESPTP